MPKVVFHLKDFDQGSSIHEPYVVGTSVARGTFKNVYKAIPVFALDQKRTKNGTYLIIILNLFICLFSNSSQTIGVKGLRCSGFDGVIPGIL